MHLFHQRPMCLIGTLILLPALLLMRFAGSLALSGIVLLLVLSLFLSRLGKVSRLAVVLMLVLCASIFLTWLHPRAILSRSTPDDTFSFTVSEATQNGKYIGIAVKRNGIPCPLSRISFYASEPIEVGDRVTVLGADLILSSEADASGVHASLVCRGKLSVKRDSAPILSLISQARHSFSRRLTQIGGNDGGALLSALLLGELDGLPVGTASAFRRLGISHVLAVSGMHLVVISGLLSSLLLRLRIPRRIRSPLVSLLLILYAMLVGGSPSILRALAMALVSELSFFVGKRTDSLSSLFFSGALLTILSPRMILSLSFQLSFAATFGIIVCALVIKKTMLSEHIPHLVYRFIVFPSLMSLSALIFTLPITLSTFGTLSLAALPANLLLAPMYELLLCLGIPALCIGPLAPIRFAVGGASRALLIATEQVSEIPFLLLDASHPLLSTLFTLLAALLLFHLLGRRCSRRSVLKTVIPTVALLVLSVAFLAFPTLSHRQITVYSNGKDGELLLLSCGHERAVIDLSPESRASLSSLKKELSRNAVTELSFYLPTEYGSETISSVKQLAEKYLLRLVLLPEAKSEREQTLKLRLIDFLKQERISFRLLEGDSLSISDYRLTLARSSDEIYHLTLGYGGKTVHYLSGSAVGLLHYGTLPNSDTLILGSRGATASRLPDTASFAEHLVLCAEVYPEIYHSGRVTRVDGALKLGPKD